MTIREKNARQARCAEGLWLASLLGLAFCPAARRTRQEKVLLLSVLKEGRPDPKLCALPKTAKTGEQLVQSNDLSNTERKCMQQDCLLALAANKGADVVLAGRCKSGQRQQSSLGVLLTTLAK